MGYGDVAIKAVLMCKSDDQYNPCDAWALAAQEHYPSSQSAQLKGCPKGAFLGLCSEGLVRGISRRRYSRAIQKVEAMLSKQYVFFNTMKLNILNYLAQYNFGIW